jgi:hypothetical protein
LKTSVPFPVHRRQRKKAAESKMLTFKIYTEIETKKGLYLRKKEAKCKDHH